MRVVVTGAAGFLGWHLRCRMRAVGRFEVVPVDRDAFSDLDAAVAGADAVVHLAGVNRAADDREVVDANVTLARRVGEAVARSGGSPRLIFANSVQSGNGTAYGEAKSEATQLLHDAARSVGSPYVDVVLPNLFGEHGRPFYNSFVATFCHQVVAGEQPTVDDRGVELLHAQEAAEVLLRGLIGLSRTERPHGTVVEVADVLDTLRRYDSCYAAGDFPETEARFGRQLFNTYRVAAFERRGPIPLVSRSDRRGTLVETARAHGSAGQSFVSTTVPGARRGEHFHLDKVERFVVLRGQGRIRLRRLFSDHVSTYDVSGDAPVAVDMPTMWVHDLTNTGDSELVVAFWTDTVFDPVRPDTFAETIEGESADADHAGSRG